MSVRLPLPVDSESRQERYLDALVEIAQLLESSPPGRVVVETLVRVIESAANARLRLVLNDGEGVMVDAAGASQGNCLEQAGCRARIENDCPVVTLRTRNLPTSSETSDDWLVSREQRTVGVMVHRGRICVPVVARGEAVGSLSADTDRLEPDELAELERFLRIVAAMLATDVSQRVRVARERARFAEENLRLRDALGERLRPEHLVGNSHPMRELYARIAQVAPSDTTVLIRGESGTGKELVASALHYGSPRAKGPFVRVNVAALGEQLLESELFGHEKGAFTGATHTRIGRIEEAQGGTLFLDEVGDFSQVAQVKLLRVLQEREFERVGNNRTLRANVRIVAATNRNLEEAVAKGTFRHDLYYRINVFALNLPPLRVRADDVLLLANHFAAVFSQRMSKTITRISSPAIDALLAYHWPGNVRELENVIEHAVLLATDGVIFEHNLPPTLQLPRAEKRSATTLAQRVEVLERDMIQDALKRTGGNVAAAARELGLTARVTRYKIKALGLHLPEVTLHARESDE